MRNSRVVPRIGSGYSIGVEAPSVPAPPPGYPFYNKPAWTLAPTVEEIYNWGCKDYAYPFSTTAASYHDGSGQEDIRAWVYKTGRYTRISAYTDYAGNPYNGGAGDPTQPFGKPYNIWVTTYRGPNPDGSGFVGGVGPCTFTHKPYNLAGSWPNGGLGYSRDYYVHVFKLVGPLNGPESGVNYEFNSSGNKHGWLGSGVGPGEPYNQCIPKIENGTGSQAILPDFGLGFYIQGPTMSYNPATGGSPGYTARPNRNGYNSLSRWPVGEWQVWEFERICNTKASVTGPGPAPQYRYFGDGVVRWWVNGTLILEKTDLVWCHNPPPSSLSSVHQLLGNFWNPTYGGGPDVKTREDNIFTCYEYSCGDTALIVG